MDMALLRSRLVRPFGLPLSLKCGDHQIGPFSRFPLEEPGRQLTVFLGLRPGTAKRGRRSFIISAIPPLGKRHATFLAAEQVGVEGYYVRIAPPDIAEGASLADGFVPKPTGTRWYHSHEMAGKDLTRSVYSGMYGFLIVEPASDPGRSASSKRTSSSSSRMLASQRSPSPSFSAANIAQAPLSSRAFVKAS